MRAGLLRHRINLQQRVNTQQPSGGMLETWPTVATVWGGVSPGKGVKQLDVAQIDAPQLTKIRIRFRAGVDTSYRVEFRGQVYEVVDVVDWELRGVFMDLTCTAFQVDGFRGAKL